MSRFTAAVSVAAAALAAWLSQATLAFTGTGDARIAIFPLSIGSLLIVVSAAALVWVAWRAGASLAPLWLLVLIALPWLSASAPPAFLIWSGPMVLAVWTAMALAILADAAAAFRRTNGPVRVRPAEKRVHARWRGVRVRYRIIVSS